MGRLRQRTSDTPEARFDRQMCRQVQCPRCGANSGAKCIGVRGQRRASSHTERWQAYDPNNIGAKAQRKERSVSNDTNEDEITCNRCGEAGLHWADHYRGDGAADRRLFNSRNRLHECRGTQPNPDDFQEVTE